MLAKKLCMHAMHKSCIYAFHLCKLYAGCTVLRCSKSDVSMVAKQCQCSYLMQFVKHVGGLKDVGFAQRLASECGVNMPMGELMLDHLKQAGDRGWTDLDWTAVTRIIREPAGIKEED